MPSTQQLIHAIESKKNERVSLLLRRMDVEAINGTDRFGRTPLIWACIVNNRKATEQLVAVPGINVNAGDLKGDTPLHCASRNFKSKTVISQLLAIPGINVNAGKQNGETPLHSACRNNRGQAVEQLFSTPSIDVNAKDTEGCTPIMWAAMCCSIEALKLMLEDPRVNIDVKYKHNKPSKHWTQIKENDQGRKLKDLVGEYNCPARTEKTTCLALIKERISKEKNRIVMQEQNNYEGINGQVEQEENQEGHEDMNGQNENVFDEMRENVRIQQILKIDKVNEDIKDKENLLKDKQEIKNIKRKELKERQYLEKEALEWKSMQDKIKLEQKKNKLKQELAETEQNMAMAQKKQLKDNEEMFNRHKHEEIGLEETFKIEDEKDQQELASMKEIINQLARDLINLEMNPSNDTSSHQRKTINDTRETLECPVCMELMKPPVRIWMCPSSHIICETCKLKLEGTLCPTCRTEKVTLRAFIVEQIARTLFNE